MNEPARLRDEGSEEVRALIRAGSATRPMTREERDRTGARIGKYAAAAALAGGIAWLPGAAFGAGIGVAAVVVAWGVPALMSPAPAPRPTAAPLPVVTAHAASPPPPAAQPTPPPPPAPAAPPAPPPALRTSAAPPPPSARSSADAPDPLAEEAALLERARAALSASPAEALALAQEHAARFPAGKLGMEREIVTIDALRRLGRRDEARARGEALLARTQGSLYEARIHKLLDGLR